MSLVPGAMAALTSLAAFLSGDVAIGWIFLGMGTLFVAVGLGAYFGLPSDDTLSVNASFALASTAWLLFSVSSALPFALWSWIGEAPSELARWDNWLFEGTSAATSTGLTIINDPAALPPAFQLWRSLCQWIGGLGIVVLALVFLDGDNRQALLRGARREQSVEKDVTSTASSMWKVHGLLTAGFIVLFGLLGMPWWEAVNHGLTAVSTGGFTMNTGGIGAYSRTVQIAVMLAMIAGAISYFSYFTAAVKRKPAALFALPNLVFYLFLLGGSGLVYLTTSRIHDLDDIFLWISALTTCGFSTVSPESSGPTMVWLLIGAMFVGGMAGSTAGGVKISRLIAVLQYLHTMLKQFLQSGRRKSFEALENKTEKKLEIDFRLRLAFLLTGLWILASVLGTLLLMLTYPGWTGSPLSCLFEILSALGCVGLSMEIVTPELAVFPKLIICLLMWAGRLEILSVVVFFAVLWPKRLKG